MVIMTEVLSQSHTVIPRTALSEAGTPETRAPDAVHKRLNCSIEDTNAANANTMQLQLGPDTLGADARKGAPATPWGRHLVKRLALLCCLVDELCEACVVSVNAELYDWSEGG